MPAVIARSVRAAAITSGGPTQDFTISGFGTPKAALFIVTSAITDATSADHARFSVGFTDGTDEACVAVLSFDAGLVADTKRVGFFDGTVINHLTAVCKASFDSFITDGVRINWSTLPTEAFFVTVILFGGSSLSAKVVKATLGGSDGNTASPTIGFQADQLITLTYGCESGHFDGTVLDDLMLCVGIAQRGGSQFSMNWFDEDGAGTQQVAAYMSSNRVAQYITDDATLGAAIEVTAFGSTTVTFNERGAQTNGMAIAALALKYDPAMSSSCQQDSTPTVTGNKSYTTTGSYKPQFIFCLGTQLSALDSLNNGALSGAMSLCCYSASENHTNTARSDDAAGTSDTATMSRSGAAENVFTDTGGVGILATLVSMDSGGWTLNYSNVGGNARVWARLIIGEPKVALSASVLAESTLSPLLRDAKPLVVTVSAESTLSPLLRAAKPLAASVLAESTLSPALRVAKVLSASVLVESTLSPSLRVARALSASVLAESTLSPLLRDTKPLSASVLAESLLSSTLTTGDIQLSVQVLVESSLAPTLRVAKALSVIVAAESLVSANMPVARALAASVLAESSLAPTLRVARALSASVLAESILSPSLTTGLVQLAVEILAESLLSATLTGVIPLAVVVYWFPPDDACSLKRRGGPRQPIIVARLRINGKDELPVDPSILEGPFRTMAQVMGTALGASDIEIRRQTRTYISSTGQETLLENATIVKKAPAPYPYRDHQIDGEVVRRGDMQLIVPAEGLGSFVPRQEDLVYRECVLWRVISVDHLTAGNQAAAYILQLRQ